MWFEDAVQIYYLNFIFGGHGVRKKTAESVFSFLTRCVAAVSNDTACHAAIAANLGFIGATNWF
jgi:hypothetical protein